MPGKTGKRHKPPTSCVECGLKIVGDFMRDRAGDMHLECWQKRFDQKSGRGKMELKLGGLISRALLPIEERRIADGMAAIDLPEPKTEEEMKRQIEKLLDGARALQSLDDLGPEANDRIEKAMKWLMAKAKRLETMSS